jgi:cell division protein FtsW
MLIVIFLTLLWVIGAPVRIYVSMIGLMAFSLLILIIVAPYRLQRLTQFLHPEGSPGCTECPGQVGGRGQRLVRSWARR